MKPRLRSWNLTDWDIMCYVVLKEERHNRFNLISEERLNIFKHNSENLMKIG